MATAAVDWEAEFAQANQRRRSPQTVPDWETEFARAEQSTSGQTTVDWEAEFARAEASQGQSSETRAGGVAAASRSALGRIGRDIGVTAAKGLLGVPQAITGIADMIPVTEGIPGSPLTKLAARQAAKLAGVSPYG